MKRMVWLCSVLVAMLPALVLVYGPVLAQQYSVPQPSAPAAAPPTDNPFAQRAPRPMAPHTAPCAATPAPTSPYAPRASESTCYQPYPSVTPSPATCKHAHLQAAAQHLEAAGLKEEAAKLSERAEHERRESLVAEKLSQIKALQAEIEQLRRQATDGKKLLAYLTVMEVDVAQMRELGLDFPGFTALDRSSPAIKTLETLKKSQGVKILAEPAIMLDAGRPAKFLAGGKVPMLAPQADGTVGVSWLEYGNKVDLETSMLDAETVRAGVHIDISSLNCQGEVPDLKHHMRVHTTVVSKFGETIVLSGLLSQGEVKRCACEEEASSEEVADSDEGEKECDGATCKTTHCEAGCGQKFKQMVVMLRFEELDAATATGLGVKPASATLPLEGPFDRVQPRTR